MKSMGMRTKKRGNMLIISHGCEHGHVSRTGPLARKNLGFQITIKKGERVGTRRIHLPPVRGGRVSSSIQFTVS